MKGLPLGEATKAVLWGYTLHAGSSPLNSVGGVLFKLGVAPIANYAFRRWVTSNGGRLVKSIFQPTPQLIVGALVLATVIALLGAVVPSRRAARLEALEALRYE